jgi:hypothetical protein
MQKRFKVSRIAKASDMDSNFNPVAVGALRACEGDLRKGEVGLLCGASSIRRRQLRVHELAQKLGWSYMPEDLAGEGWSWGSDVEGSFTKGVNLYVKLLYYDQRMTDVTADDPWLVCVTGDAARVSQRGVIVTTCGAKECDRRLPSQLGAYCLVCPPPPHPLSSSRTSTPFLSQPGTGKGMNQSRKLYTPMLAGYASETKLMPHFHALVSTFKEIEERGYCEVDGVQYEVPIKVVVVADMSFVWKYTERGCASGSGSFCWMCKVSMYVCAALFPHSLSAPPLLPPPLSPTQTAVPRPHEAPGVSRRVQILSPWQLRVRRRGESNLQALGAAHRRIRQVGGGEV